MELETKKTGSLLSLRPLRIALEIFNADTNLEGSESQRKAKLLSLISLSLTLGRRRGRLRRTRRRRSWRRILTARTSCRRRDRRPETSCDGGRRPEDRRLADGGRDVGREGTSRRRSRHPCRLSSSVDFGVALGGTTTFLRGARTLDGLTLGDSLLRRGRASFGGTRLTTFSRSRGGDFLALSFGGKAL